MVSFIESPFATKAEYERWIAAGMASLDISESPPSPDSLPDASQESHEWCPSDWLQSLDLHEHVVSELSQLLRGGVSGGSSFNAVCTLSKDVLQRQLAASGLSGLMEPIWNGVEKLRRQGAATGHALNAKFAADGGTFELATGSLDQFFDGLEGLLGPPLLHEGSILKSMGREHTTEADSSVPFNTSNGMFGVTSREEWEFVADPSPGEVYLERQSFRSEESAGLQRKAIPLKEMEGRMDGINARLTERRFAPMIVEELVGGRLYTGPMYEKYNSVLRFFSGTTTYASRAAVPFLQTKCEQLGLGEWFEHPGDATDGTAGVRWKWLSLTRYATTIHSINSAVLKLSRLTTARPVYRGFSGARLPASFWEASADGVAGGVEFAFMSTSCEREQAVHYASGATPTVLQMRMGLIDRGAELSWLSQYPHEAEILFPPLTSMETLGTHVDGNRLIVDMRLTLNLGALTLEQVIGKRFKLLRDMASTIVGEVRSSNGGAGGAATEDGGDDALGKLSIKILQNALEKGPLSGEVETFNEDSAFADAVGALLRLKQKVMFDAGRLQMITETVEPPSLGEYAPVALRCLSHTEEAVRQAALVLLAKLTPEALQAHATRLMERLTDSHADVRRAAVDALATLGGNDDVLERVLGQFMPMLTDSRGEVPAAALQALLALGVRKLSSASGGEAVLSAVRTLAEDEDASLQNSLHAHAVLASLTPGGGRPEENVHAARLVRAMGEMDEYADAEVALCAIAEVDVLDGCAHALLSVLGVTTHDQNDLSEAVLRVLGKARPEAITAHLDEIVSMINRVDAPDGNRWEPVRRYALESLKLVQEEMITQPVVDAVARRIRDEGWDVLRKAGLEALQRVAQPEVLSKHAELIASRLEHEGWDCVRLEAVVAMERLTVEALSPHAAALSRTVVSEDWAWVRQRALEVISRLPDDVIREHCISSVRRSVNDDEGSVRRVAREIASRFESAEGKAGAPKTYGDAGA
jgi:hypothetical protein